jgi:hypothetical protein
MAARSRIAWRNIRQDLDKGLKIVLDSAATTLQNNMRYNPPSGKKFVNIRNY